MGTSFQAWQKKKKNSKVNLTLYFPQVLLTSRPNPAGQFLDVSNPAGQFIDVSNPAGQFLDISKPAGQFLDVSNPAGQFFYSSNPAIQFQHNKISEKFFLVCQ